MVIFVQFYDIPFILSICGFSVLFKSNLKKTQQDCIFAVKMSVTISPKNSKTHVCKYYQIGNLANGNIALLFTISRFHTIFVYLCMYLQDKV